MTKRVNILTVVLAVLLVPSLAFAADLHKFSTALEANPGQQVNTIEIPLIITNQNNLTAMDIPLKFSEGVTLQRVDFEGTRVDYFDMKIASIDNENHTVLIGLLPQMSPEHKPDLKAGSGEIARLVFEVTDPTVETVTIKPTVLEKPFHQLAFVYHDLLENGKRSIRLEKIDFPSTTVALGSVGAPSNEMPQKFSLMPNYPNPFNPSTVIRFDLPNPSHVTLTVFNVLGQTVSTLVNSDMPAGNHEVTWDASANSSGVYFYRISTDTKTDTKKMLLLK